MCTRWAEVAPKAVEAASGHANEPHCRARLLSLHSWLAKHAPPELLQAWEVAPDLAEKSPQRIALKQWAARYLGRELQDGKPLDAVARFHLGNGARVERLNWSADPSAKGFRQSYGLMVNYLYDLKKLDRNRAALAQGKIPVAPAIKDLLA